MLYLAGESGGLGVLAEDNLSRLRFEPSLGLAANQARFQVGDFALDARKSYTMRWTLYALAAGAGCFDFVNQVRRDWHTRTGTLCARRQATDRPERVSGCEQLKERIITCASHAFVWPTRKKPAVHLFDLDGREKAHTVSITRSSKGWTVRVELEDWAEFAIVEDSR
jgi:hypothetical protein